VPSSCLSPALCVPCSLSPPCFFMTYLALFCPSTCQYYFYLCCVIIHPSSDDDSKQVAWL
jgi:hypothetical protein